MHVFDPHGTIHAYRVAKHERDRSRVLFFAILTIAVLVFLCAGVNLACNHFAR